MIDPVRLIEALLFASAAPLSAKDLYERVGEDVDVGAALMELQKQYEGRGVVLVEMESRWAFRTAQDLSDALQVEKQVEKKLTKAGLETLAIIAYHQPITRAEIENIRGVSTHRGTLDVLIEQNWVKPGRRRETPGRPLTWVTSSVFLDQFSLETITDLPGLDDLKASGLLDRRPAIEAIPTSDDLFANANDDDKDEEVEESFEEKIII